MQARDRLIVALDVKSIAAAEAMVERLGPSVSFYKIGYSLAFKGGLDLAGRLIASGKQVFVDLKLHDIGNTVGNGVESIVEMGATFLTVHAYPETMMAAVKARGTSKLRLLAVTVLTSYDDRDLAAAGYTLGVKNLVQRRARQSIEAGMDGLVCSAEEATSLRSIAGADMALVTPGIRPSGASAGDQKRVMTPTRAIEAGADYLVVGRPILEADDPKAAADAIAAEIDASQKPY
jgi:orotidine-5'-phosphate decarboxylase